MKLAATDGSSRREPHTGIMFVGLRAPEALTTTIKSLQMGCAQRT